MNGSDKVLFYLVLFLAEWIIVLFEFWGCSVGRLFECLEPALCTQVSSEKWSVTCNNSGTHLPSITGIPWSHLCDLFTSNSADQFWTWRYLCRSEFGTIWSCCDLGLLRDGNPQSSCDGCKFLAVIRGVSTVRERHGYWLSTMGHGYGYLWVWVRVGTRVPMTQGTHTHNPWSVPTSTHGP